ncbi:MAG: signal peptidase I [Spirochaetaceae bacterium]
MLGGSRPRYRFYKQERSAGARVLAVLKFLLLLFLAHELVTTFLVAGYSVESSSMRPTLEPGDRLIVSSLPYGAWMPLPGTRAPALGSPERGDLVVVRTSYTPRPARLLYPVRSALRFFSAGRLGDERDDWRSEIMLRRIVAVPGDTVRMDDFIFYVRDPAGGSFRSEFEASGIRYPLIRDGIPSGWSGDLPFAADMEAMELGENEYFLASDDRIAGLDSRHRGPASGERLLSRVVLRYWPISRFGVPRP